MLAVSASWPAAGELPMSGGSQSAGHSIQGNDGRRVSFNNPAEQAQQQVQRGQQPSVHGQPSQPSPQRSMPQQQRLPQTPVPAQQQQTPQQQQQQQQEQQQQQQSPQRHSGAPFASDAMPYSPGQGNNATLSASNHPSPNGSGVMDGTQPPPNMSATANWLQGLSGMTNALSASQAGAMPSADKRNSNPQLPQQPDPRAGMPQSPPPGQGMFRLQGTQTSPAMLASTGGGAPPGLTFQIPQCVPQQQLQQQQTQQPQQQQPPQQHQVQQVQQQGPQRGATPTHMLPQQQQGPSSLSYAPTNAQQGTADMAHMYDTMMAPWPSVQGVWGADASMHAGCAPQGSMQGHGSNAPTVPSHHAQLDARLQDSSTHAGVPGEQQGSNMPSNAASAIDPQAVRESFTRPVPLHWAVSSAGLQMHVLWKGQIHAGMLVTSAASGRNMARESQIGMPISTLPASNSEKQLAALTASRPMEASNSGGSGGGGNAGGGGGDAAAVATSAGTNAPGSWPLQQSSNQFPTPTDALVCPHRCTVDRMVCATFVLMFWIMLWSAQVSSLQHLLHTCTALCHFMGSHLCNAAHACALSLASYLRHCTQRSYHRSRFCHGAGDGRRPAQQPEQPQHVSVIRKMRLYQQPAPRQRLWRATKPPAPYCMQPSCSVLSYARQPGAQWTHGVQRRQRSGPAAADADAVRLRHGWRWWPQAAQGVLRQQPWAWWRVDCAATAGDGAAVDWRVLWRQVRCCEKVL